MTRSEAIKYVQRFALCLFFFSINFEVWDPLNTEGFISLSKFTGLIYVFTIIPLIRFFNKADTRNPFLLSIWSFFVMLTFSGLFSINVISYDYFDFTIFQNIVMFWFLLIHERKDPFVLERGMLSFALGSVVLAILFYAGRGTEYEEGRVRIFGDNENLIGLKMSISMAILAVVTVQNRLNFGKSRYLLLIPIPIMLQLMVETASRVAFISFALILVTGMVLLKTKRIIGRIVVLTSGAITSVIVWVYMIQSGTLMERLLFIYEQRGLGGRQLIWQELVPLIESNPIFGVGKTGYSYFSQMNFGLPISPHNVILEVLCYTGIVGLIIYLMYLYLILKRACRKYKREGLLLPLLLLVPVIGMIVSGQILEAKIGWVIFAYIAGGSVLKQNQRQFAPGHNENDNASQNIAFHR